MLSAFISYGGPDQAFAERLRNDLLIHEVKTFLFAQDATPGEKLHVVMRQGVNDHDRAVVICSRSGLTRPGVLNEIDEILQREAREGGSSVLIPVSLDDFIFDELPLSHPDLAQVLCSRVIADFRLGQFDASIYATALDRLLIALRPQKRRSRRVAKEGPVRNSRKAEVPNLHCFITGFGFGRATSIVISPDPQNASILVGFAQAIGLPAKSLRELNVALQMGQPVENLFSQLIVIQKIAMLVRDLLPAQGALWFDLGKVLHDARYAEYLPQVFLTVEKQISHIEKLMQSLAITPQSEVGEQLIEFIQNARATSPAEALDALLNTLPPAIATRLGFVG